MPKKVYFKFKPDVSDAARSEALALLRKRGARAVRRQFPTEPDLTDHYVAVGTTPAQASKLIDLLRSVDAIAFAHGDVKRRPL